MLNKGIPAKDLRPFSMDDPLGLGVTSPTQARLRERFHRKQKKRGDNSASAQVASAVVRRAAQELAKKKRAPAPARAQQQQQSTQEKKKSGGCLTVLVVIGVLYGLGTVFIPPIINTIEQKIVMETGNRAHARIISSESTGTEIMDETVHDLTVEMHVPGYDPYQVQFSQALPDSQSRHLGPDVWAEVRYDADDLTTIALVSVGVPNPNLDRPEGSVTDQLQDAQDLLDAQKRQIPVPGDVVLPTPKRPNNTAPQPDAAPPPSDPTPQPDDPSLNPAPDTDDFELPAPQPQPQKVTLACSQAAACCRIAGGGACSGFTKPGVPAKSCRQALRGFSRLAKAAGKNCSGLP